MGDIDTWERFDKEADHRLREIDKRTTPRQHHINNVVKVGNEILVTRGKSESVTTLDGHALINGLPGMPHDGFIFNGEFYLSTVVNADKLIVLGDGQVLEEGMHQELIGKKGAYWELYRSQSM